MSWDGALHWGKTIFSHEYMSPLQIQLSLYTYLSTEFIGTASIYSAIRRVGTVLQLMHMLKYYYWVINPADISGITPEGLGESLLLLEYGLMCVSVRLILLLKVTKGRQSVPAIMWFHEPAMKASKRVPEIQTIQHVSNNLWLKRLRVGF